MKHFRRFARISHHQETETVKLEKILFLLGHADFFPKRQSYAPQSDRKGDIKEGLKGNVDLTPAFANGARPLQRFRGY
jgi:hypothetical protein